MSHLLVIVCSILATQTYADEGCTTLRACAVKKGTCISKPSACAGRAFIRRKNCSQGCKCCLPPVCSPACVNGKCVSTNICNCSPGWMGDNCTQDINECDVSAGGCSQICNNTNGSFFCSCFNGYSLNADGKSCAATCNPGCINGNCTNPNQCSCEPGWKGRSCEIPECTLGCINGKCHEPNTCDCIGGWSGTLCDKPICTPSCENNGKCTQPNYCDCPSGYDGYRCEELIHNNSAMLTSVRPVAVVKPDSSLGIIVPSRPEVKPGPPEVPGRPEVRPGVLPITGYCYNMVTGAYDVSTGTQITDACNVFICTIGGWTTLSIQPTCCVFLNTGYPDGYALTEHHSDVILTCSNGQWTDNSKSTTAATTTTPCWTWCTDYSTTTLPGQNVNEPGENVNERKIGNGTSSSQKPAITTTPSWCDDWCDYDY